jgi:hypothetical protein
LDNFIKYFERTVVIYSVSNLTPVEKKEVFEVIFSNYVNYLRTLMTEHFSGENRAETGNGRIKKAVKILLSGKL